MSDYNPHCLQLEKDHVRPSNHGFTRQVLADVYPLTMEGCRFFFITLTCRRAPEIYEALAIEAPETTQEDPIQPGLGYPYRSIHDVFPDFSKLYLQRYHKGYGLLPRRLANSLQASEDNAYSVWSQIPTHYVASVAEKGIPDDSETI